ncbi:hypothetical protein QJQ45_017025 [Haematococcus lacustris]|nr:hypothetical protein QJQ45_017025 [Haematococcus lacustris]
MAAAMISGLVSQWLSAPRELPPAQFWALHAFSTLALALALMMVSATVETLTHRTLKWLEQRGVIERLSPQIPETQHSFQAQTALTFLTSSWFVLLIVMHPAVLSRLLALAKPRFDVLEIAYSCYVGVVAHDLWFFLIHSQLHRIKWLYRWIHITHHRNMGDLNVFGTADMDPFEAVAMVFSFYAATLLWGAYVVGSWNPWAYTALILLEANMNMMGHCGYRQPLWLAIIQSWGICLTPGVAHAKTHYIHHLDPRMNRALYFSWWDRLAGSWRDKHPAIREFTPAEQLEYELRAFRMLAGVMAKWLPPKYTSSTPVAALLKAAKRLAQPAQSLLLLASVASCHAAPA